MRTTLNLDDHLVRQAKELALRTRRTLSEVIEDSLRLSLSGRKPEPFDLPVGFLHFPPHLDLSNNAAVLEWLEREEAADGTP